MIMQTLTIMGSESMSPQVVSICRIAATVAGGLKADLSLLPNFFQFQKKQLFYFSNFSYQCKKVTSCKERQIDVTILGSSHSMIHSSCKTDLSREVIKHFSLQNSVKNMGYFCGSVLCIQQYLSSKSYLGSYPIGNRSSYL